jgi:hypothetical protein
MVPARVWRAILYRTRPCPSDGAFDIAFDKPHIESFISNIIAEHPGVSRERVQQKHVSRYWKGHACIEVSRGACEEMSLTTSDITETASAVMFAETRVCTEGQVPCVSTYDCVQRAVNMSMPLTRSDDFPRVVVSAIRDSHTPDRTWYSVSIESLDAPSLRQVLPSVISACA